jgi:hypothetical protein
MKKISILFLFLVASLQVYPQPTVEETKAREIKTLFGQNSMTKGGYGGFGGGYSVIDDRNGAVMSGRAAWIIGHSLALGFAGTGFINEFEYTSNLDRNANLTGGYGGLLIEPIMFPMSPVHMAFPVIAGFGAVAYTTTPADADPWSYPTPRVEETGTFLIVEPGVEIEMNVFKFFRLAFGLSYRFTSEIQLMNTPPDALNGIAAGVSFKFGKF